MFALVAERPVLGPGAVDQVDRLPVARAGLRLRDVVVEGLGPAAHGEAGDEPPAAHRIDHRVFLGDAQRIEMERQEIAEHDELRALGALRQRRRDEIRRRHQAIDVLVMLVEDEPVETQLLGIGQLVDIFLVQSVGLFPVPQAVRHRDPAAVEALVEIRGQIGIRHEVPAIEFDRSHGFLLSLLV